MESVLFVFLYESFQVDSWYTGVANNRPATELRKFFACTESTNALIVLGVQADKNRREARVEGRVCNSYILRRHRKVKKI